MTDQPTAPALHPDPKRDRQSPCIGVCYLEPSSGLCSGCGRTAGEIAEWPGMSDVERLAVYARLPSRAVAVGARARLLAWSPEEILDFVDRTVREKEGCWAVGSGANAGAITAGALGNGRITRERATISIAADNATLRISIHEKLRAFAMIENGRDGLIVLGLPKRRADELLAQRLGPRRDWLVPPTDAADEDSCACRGNAGKAVSSRIKFVTALASLAVADPQHERATALMTRAAALPRFAVAMAVYDPASVPDSDGTSR